MVCGLNVVGVEPTLDFATNRAEEMWEWRMRLSQDVKENILCRLSLFFCHNNYCCQSWVYPSQGCFRCSDPQVRSRWSAPALDVFQREQQWRTRLHEWKMRKRGRNFVYILDNIWSPIINTFSTQETPWNTLFIRKSFVTKTLVFHDVTRPKQAGVIFETDPKIRSAPADANV